MAAVKAPRSTIIDWRPRRAGHSPAPTEAVGASKLSTRSHAPRGNAKTGRSAAGDDAPYDQIEWPRVREEHDIKPLHITTPSSRKTFVQSTKKSLYDICCLIPVYLII